MGKHILGVKRDGVMARFTHEYSDDEFYALVEEIGGVLPPGWAAWHLEDGEDYKNSKKALALMVRVPSIIGRYGVQASRVWIVEMLKDDVAKYRTRSITA